MINFQIYQTISIYFYMTILSYYYKNIGLVNCWWITFVFFRGLEEMSIAAVIRGEKIQKTNHTQYRIIYFFMKEKNTNNKRQQNVTLHRRREEINISV